MENSVIQGDCLAVMATLPDNSVDAVVTDPPYGLSFMGKKWDYDVPTVEVWCEVLRVLKPGGHLLSFAGTRTYHRMAVNIEDAGFDIRDMVAWCYGSGFPKSHNLSGDWQGWGSALKPALEPIALARKPIRGAIAQNVQEWGTGALNIDGCRVATDEVGSPREKDTARMTRPDWRMTGGSTGSGASNPAGRWPANLIHDGSEEVLGVFPEGRSSGVYSPSDHHNNECIQSVVNFGGKGTPFTMYADSGSAARFFYCAKASKADRDEGLEGFEERIAGVGAVDENSGRDSKKPGNQRPGGARRRVEQGLPPTMPRRNHHPTVKPTDLMRYLCRLITPPGGLILDPFAGSGSTGKAAVLEGFGFIGIEQDPEYVEIARARIAAVQRPEVATLETQVKALRHQKQKADTGQLALF